MFRNINSSFISLTMCENVEELGLFRLQVNNLLLSVQVEVGQVPFLLCNGESVSYMVLLTILEMFSTIFLHICISIFILLKNKYCVVIKC